MRSAGSVRPARGGKASACKFDVVDHGSITSTGLASNAGDYITGQMTIADGGVLSSTMWPL